MKRRPSENGGRRFVVYALLFCLTTALGLATRKYSEWFPEVVARYGGDVLWATMVFWLVALCLRRASTVAVAAITFGIAFAVELSQLYHAPWIDAIRATRIGALALGSGFLWSDLLCYAIGVVLAVGVEALVTQTSRETKSAA